MELEEMLNQYTMPVMKPNAGQKIGQGLTTLAPAASLIAGPIGGAAVATVGGIVSAVGSMFQADKAEDMQSHLEAKKNSMINVYQSLAEERQRRTLNFNQI